MPPTERDPGVAAAVPVPPGVQKYQQLVQGGFSPAEANAWAQEQTKTLQGAGFKPSEIDAYWGTGTPASKAITDHITTNIDINSRTGARTAQNPLDAFAAGWDRSVSGLVLNRHAPDVVMPKDPGLVSTVTNIVGQFTGDAPAAVAGFFGGASVGAAGGPAAPVTVPLAAGAGLAGVPEAGRQVLLDAYAAHDGKIRTWQDALHVVSGSLWETGKQTVVGGISNLVGGQVAGKLEAAGVSHFVSGGANAGSQLVAGTTAGAVMDGHMPDARDFEAAAIVALGLHTSTAIAGGRGQIARAQSNLQTIYRQTGVPPWEAAERAQRDPNFKQEIMSQDVQGDPVAPQFRNVAPNEPEPFHPIQREGTQGPATGGFMPAQRPAPEGQTLLPAPKPNQVYANDVPHAMELLRKLEGSGDAAVSPKGAVGRYQIMPATARQYMGPNFDVNTLHDPQVNEAVATRVVGDLFRRYNGDMNAIAVAYNAGPGRAGEYLKAGPGTALEAIPDKTARGGIRYEEEPSRHDESHLPLETQRYLANARRRMGTTAEAPGGEGEQPGPKKIPSYEEADLAGGGAGGGEPPGGGRVGPEELEGPGKRNPWMGKSEDTLTDAIMQNVGEPPKPKSLLDPDRVLGQFFSELTPARRLDDRLIKAGEMDRTKDLGAEDMFRQTYASDARAGVFMRFGKIDPITLDVEKGSTTVFDAAHMVKEAGGNMDGWTAYMLAKRTMDKKAQGIDTGFNPNAAEATVANKKMAKKYQAATDALQDVFKGVLEYSRDSGVHSQDQLDAMMRDNPTYISMRRIMGDDESFTPGSGRSFRATDALRKMEGSDKQIIDPIAATLDNIRLIVKMADRNRAIGHVIGMVERGELSGFKQLPFDPVATIADAGSDVFTPYGLDPHAAAETYAPAIAERANGKGSPNDFVFIRDGKPELWHADDPNLAELLRKADSPGQANIVMKAFQTFAGLERAGIVVSPDFPTRVTLRHQVTAFIADPLHPPPFVTWARGIFHVIGQDEVYQDAVAKGALGVALADMDTNWLQRDMDAVFTETGTWSSVWNVVQHPLEFARIISERMDAGARVGYMLHGADKGVEPIKAAMLSRKAYLDYAEKGTAQVAQTMAQIVPFFRPHLLGLKQFGEAMAERPGSTLAYGAMAVGIPTVALYALNYFADKALPDGQKYADLPQWQKDNYWITPPIFGVRFRLRYPPNMGFPLGGAVTRALDYAAQKDPHAFEGSIQKFLEEYVPPLMPTIAQVPTEAIANYSFFTGKPIVPSSMEKASGYMQYTPSTSETAKALSRALGPPGLDILDFSPIQFDHYVKGWSGTVGQDVLHALDVPLHHVAKPWELADIPFVASFVTRNPGMSAQPIQQFYEGMDKLERAQGDFALAMRRAEQGAQSDEIDLSAEASQYASAVAPIKQALNLQAAAIQGIATNPSMSAAEKRQAIDDLYPQLVQTARQGLMVIDSLPKKGEGDKAGSEPSGPAPAPPSGFQQPNKPPAAPPPPSDNRGMVPIA